MKKKLIRSFFMSILTITMLFSSVPVFAAGAFSKSVVLPPGGGGPINRAQVVMETGAPRYSQTDVFYYLQPREARQIADKIQFSTAANVTSFFIGCFGKPGITWSAVMLAESEYRASVAKQIRNLSEKGPVVINYTKTPYRTFVTSRSWNGSVSGIDTKTYDYWKNGYHYTRKMTSFVVK